MCKVVLDLEVWRSCLVLCSHVISSGSSFSFEGPPVASAYVREAI